MRTSACAVAQAAFRRFRAGHSRKSPSHILVSSRLEGLAPGPLGRKNPGISQARRTPRAVPRERTTSPQPSRAGGPDLGRDGCRDQQAAITAAANSCGRSSGVK
jgi:hypothetical protein